MRSSICEDNREMTDKIVRFYLQDDSIWVIKDTESTKNVRNWDSR